MSSAVQSSSSSKKASKKPAAPVAKKPSTPVPVAKKSRKAEAAPATAQSRGLGVRVSGKKAQSEFAIRCRAHPLYGVPRSTIRAIMAGQGIQKSRPDALETLRNCVEDAVLDHIVQALLVCRGAGRKHLTSTDLEMSCRNPLSAQ